MSNDQTCLINRSRVREILHRVPDEYTHLTKVLLADVDLLPITATDELAGASNGAGTAIKNARGVINTKIGNIRTDLRQLREKQIALEAELRGLQDAEDVLAKHVDGK